MRHFIDMCEGISDMQDGSRKRLEEHMTVRLREAKQGFPKGTEGTLVIDYDRGEHFQIEVGPALKPVLINVSRTEVEAS